MLWKLRQMWYEASIATLHIERKIEEKVNLKMSTRISGAEKTRSVSKVLCEADVSRLYSSLVGEREKEVTLKCKRYLGSSFRFQISVLWWPRLCSSLVEEREKGSHFKSVSDIWNAASDFRIFSGDHFDHAGRQRDNKKSVFRRKNDGDNKLTLQHEY